MEMRGLSSSSSSSSSLEWREKTRQWSLMGLFLLAVTLKCRNFILSSSSTSSTSLSQGNEPFSLFRGLSSSSSSSSSSTRSRKQHWSTNQTSRLLDFYLIGFPKSGAGALATALRAHDAILLPRDDDPNRRYAISTTAPDDVAWMELEEVFSDEMDRFPSASPNQKRGLVDVSEVYTLHGVRRLFWKRCPTKLVVTLRHPVWMLESYFNYRVAAEWYRHSADAPPPAIPPALELTGDQSWKGVGLAYLRFERFLAPLLQPRAPPKQPQQPRLPVFVVFQDEWSDTNATRTRALREALADFLELPTPIRPIEWSSGHYRFVYNETMHICRAEFADLRFLIMENAIQTAAWMRQHLLHQVHHSPGDYFEQLVESFRKDPCLAASAQTHGGGGEI